VVGNPAETAIAAAHLIFGGVLDRHTNLRVILAHGGGSVPSMWHRWKHASARVPEAWTTRDVFDDYLENFYFDSVVYTRGALTRLVDFAGAAHVVVGTDMPYDMGEPHPVRQIELCEFDTDTHSTILDSSALFTRRSQWDEDPRELNVHG